MATSYNEAKTKQSKYWKNKPVMKVTDRVIVPKQISSDSDMSARFARENWTKLPENYSWDKIDISDYENMEKVCVFLSEHYRRGSESDYIVKYDVDQINWEMCHKGYFLVVNDNKNNQLVRHCVGQIMPIITGKMKLSENCQYKPVHASSSMITNFFKANNYIENRYKIIIYLMH